jgi:hypothetical protein
MNLKRILIRILWSAIPVDEQKDMVTDFLDWLFSDLTPAERREKSKRLTPRLMEWIAQGKFGLSLVVYQHITRIPVVSALSRWAADYRVTSE